MFNWIFEFIVGSWVKLISFLILITVLILSFVLLLPIIIPILGFVAFVLLGVFILLLFLLPIILIKWSFLRRLRSGHKGKTIEGEKVFVLENPNEFSLKMNIGKLEVFHGPYSESKIIYQVEEKSILTHPFKITMGNAQVYLPLSTHIIKAQMDVGSIRIHTSLSEAILHVSTKLGSVSLGIKNERTSPYLYELTTNVGEVKITKEEISSKPEQLT